MPKGLLTADQVRMLEALRGQVRFDGGARYRFHGNNEPRRVVNEIPAGPVQDGVATLRLYDPIDSWGEFWGVSAKEFTTALDALPDETHTIELHINSPGGEVFDAIAILNALRTHPAKVVAVVDGLAASAASFIACGADELVMGENAELMIHNARGVCIGEASDMQQMADLLTHLSGNIAAIYAKKAGGAVADWLDTMAGEAWFNADEAVAAGLADRTADNAPAVSNRFDLSMFHHAGRAAAPAPKAPPVRNDANDAEDANALTQALAWFTAIDSIVDDAQEALSGYLNVPNPDTDDGAMPAEGDPMAYQHRMNARRYDLPV